MNEIHEIPTTDRPTTFSHDIMVIDCICNPEVIARYQNGMPLPPIIRHKVYTPAQAASTRFVGGY